MSKEIQARPSLRFRALYWVNKIILTLSACFLGEWALYGAFRCPFVVPFISCQNCPVITCPGRLAHYFWGFWGIWIALSLLFGRAFCAWLCPTGFLNRVLALNPLKLKKYFKKQLPFTYVKHFALFVTVYIYFILNQPRVNIPIRIGEFWPSMFFTYENAFPLWQWRVIYILIGLVLAVCISAAWCRFLCPMGSILEIIKKVSLFRIYKTKECNNCGKCTRVCYMKTRPDEANCTNCGDCLDACPQHCIHIGRKKHE